MAKILTKNSVTAGSAPSGLSFGELAVNITDKKIFIGNAVEGVVTLHDQNNIVTSINGSTGAITNVARINEGNTFSVVQVMNAGVTSANLYVSGGATFTTISSSSTTDCVDILASTNGIGLRVAQNVGGGAAAVGGIRLGRSSTTALNYLLYAASGTFYVINGTGGTDPQLMTLNSVDANFNVPIRGATFSSSAGRITVQKSSYGNSESANVRIIGADATGLNTYNSDIRANADAAADTTHTLPASSGTLLNTSSTINATTSTISSSNVNATRYLAFVGGTGSTAISIDDVTTPLTYNPQGGNIGAKKVTLTTSAQVITLDSTSNTVIFTDGVDVATFGLNSISVNNGTPFEISNTNGLTFSANAIAFAGSGYGYLFPASNGTNGQALTTNGSGTLSWSTFAVLGAPQTFTALQTFSSGISSASAITGGSYLYAESGFRVGAGAINSQAGTTYTLLATDNGEVIVWNTSSDGTLTIPSGLPVGFNATLIQTGSASIGITGSGTTLNSFEGKLRTAGQHAAVSIISYSSNVFNIAGGLTG